MKNRNLIILALVLAVLAVSVVFLRGDVRQTPAQKPVVATDHHDSHPTPATKTAPRVPAYQTVAETKALGPTLPVDQFTGKTRQAYQVAKDIPQTLAQLPCYCECDRGMGHKSLHSCFEDDHASHCAVCVDEALLAYRLQKEQGLSPDQVRERIIQKYSAAE